MSRVPRLHKSVLCLALGACPFSFAPTALHAQGATGAVSGRAQAGDQIQLVNTATGATRTVTVGRNGSYTASQLPVGDYTLRLLRDGREVGSPVTVAVSLGGTTTVNLGGSGDVVNLDAIEVVGSRIVNRVDVYSTESATNITREQWARMPVDQDLTSVAMLAPGVVGGNSSFGGISFGGSSVAENSTFINGLNVTDFYRRQSFSSAPFAFFREFQVKTGGYSVEFGRSTGGVINAVTRSGSNEYEGGVEITLEPGEWRASADDHIFVSDDRMLIYRASKDSGSLNKTNVWASGPLVRDRLFFFAMYEWRDSGAKTTNSAGSSWANREAKNGFWGTKLDWHLNDDHLLELLAFSDKQDYISHAYSYDWDSHTIGGLTGIKTNDSGGKNGALTYTGRFGENFIAKAMYGINQTQDNDWSPVDDLCDQIFHHADSYGAIYRAMGSPVLGCYPDSSNLVRHEDERKVGRLDFEWTLGDHQLRFGLDREVMTTDRRTRYPGSGVRYTAYGFEPGDPLDNGAVVPDGVTQILMGRNRWDEGVFETTANAYYLEDNWSITPNFLLNMGVRVDAFNNKTATGASFIKMDNLISPRLGFSWDMRGDGNTKLFGNLGRYYLPVTNNINYTFAGGLTDERTFHVLEGWREAINPVTGTPYMEPIFGAQIGGVDDTYNIIADPRRNVDQDMKAVHQDEAILGFQSALSQTWSWGVNATYRRMKHAMDDIRINHTPCGPVGRNLWPIGNPGEPLTIWGDASIGCPTEGWITIDTSVDGYRMGESGQVVGYFKPKREYKAVEFQIDRAWDGKWSFNASYLWSKLHGNHEGPVNSDTNYGDTGMVQHWDHPANNQDYGPLFNDHRHQIKLQGSYAFNEQWSIGAVATAMSGAPITAFGVTWPNDSTPAGSVVSEGSGGGSFWHCVSNCDSNVHPISDRVYVYAPRGSGGRMPWTYNLGLNLTWTYPGDELDLKARLSVFNLLNDQEVINVRQRYEAGPGAVRPFFGTGTRWQDPRYAQLVVSWNF